MDTDSKLIPVLREGVTIIKMILYKELKAHLEKRHASKKNAYINRLSGAIINELFGTQQNKEPFISFVDENRIVLDVELATLGDNFPTLRIPLTDALRIQFLCDSLEGIDSESVLNRAKEWGILLVDRDIPFPKNFMNLSRKLGIAYHILSPQTEKDTEITK